MSLDSVSFVVGFWSKQEWFYFFVVKNVHISNFLESIHFDLCLRQKKSVSKINKYLKHIEWLFLNILWKNYNSCVNGLIAKGVKFSSKCWITLENKRSSTVIPKCYTSTYLEIMVINTFFEATNKSTLTLYMHKNDNALIHFVFTRPSPEFLHFSAMWTPKKSEKKSTWPISIFTRQFGL